MIVEVEFWGSISDDDMHGFNYRYFGDDYGECVLVQKYPEMLKYLGKECSTILGKGVIIGIEDNVEYMDYYYIVYYPYHDTVDYQLCNDVEFVKTIKI